MTKKRAELDPKKGAGMFSKTEPEQTLEETQEQADPVKAVGIGLKASEWNRIDEIAQEMGVTRHALTLWALRDFLRRYDAGEIQTQTKPTLPGLD